MGTKGLAARAPKTGEAGGSEDITLAELGARIAARRQELEMTRPQLAVAAGVDPSTIYRVEKGTTSPSVDKLLRIARALRISAAKLVKP